MKKNKNSSIYLFILNLLMSCCFSFTMAQQPAATKQATKMPAKPRISGFFKGKLPCNDCEGINYSLKFSGTDQAEEESSSSGKPGKPTISRGKFNFINDSVVFLSFTDSALNKYILRKKNTLILLDKEQKMMTGKDTDRYVLKRSADENQVKAALLNKKRRDGITFCAENKQQHWSLDIYKKEFLLFKRTLREKPDTFKINSWIDNTERGTSKIEASNKNLKKLEIDLYRQFCGDSSKADVHTYMVMVIDSLERSGCGDDILPLPGTEQAALNNMWMLEKMGSTIVDKSKGKKAPILEINEKELSFKGSGGCNAISGIIKIERSKITFDNIVASKMLCEGSIEPEFLAMLKKIDSYIISKNRLMLRSNNEIKAIFIRIN